MPTRVVVSGLGEPSTDESLRDAFARFGAIVAATAVRDPVTGQLHGYGLVVFADDDAARRAIADMNGKFLDGHEIEVRADELPSLPGVKQPG